MFKKLILVTVAVAIFYVALIFFRLWIGQGPEAQKAAKPASDLDPTHKVYSFSFSKYATSGGKELEIEGDSANIFSKNVALINVIAKAYADDTPVTITADKGVLDKSTSTVHLENNVVATTDTGARLLSHSLDLHPAEKYVETEDQAQVRHDNMAVEGTGVHGDSQLKKVKFKNKVTVVIQDNEQPNRVPTVITCDGPLDVDYEANIARFYRNVVATDFRGRLTADQMDVYYDQVTKKLKKIICLGNVVITNKEGHQTYSDKVIYWAQEGRVILGGNAEGMYIPDSKSSGVSEDDFFLIEEKT